MVAPYAWISPSHDRVEGAAEEEVVDTEVDAAAVVEEATEAVVVDAATEAGDAEVEEVS